MNENKVKKTPLLTQSEANAAAGVTDGSLKKWGSEIRDNEAREWGKSSVIEMPCIKNINYEWLRILCSKQHFATSSVNLSVRPFITSAPWSAWVDSFWIKDILIHARSAIQMHYHIIFYSININFALIYLHIYLFSIYLYIYFFNLFLSLSHSLSLSLSLTHYRSICISIYHLFLYHISTYMSINISILLSYPSLLPYLHLALIFEEQEIRLSQNTMLWFGLNWAYLKKYICLKSYFWKIFGCSNIIPPFAKTLLKVIHELNLTIYFSFLTLFWSSFLGIFFVGSLTRNPADWKIQMFAK